MRTHGSPSRSRNVAGALCVALVFVAAQAVLLAATPAPDEMVIEKVHSKKPGVWFPHAKHTATGEAGLGLACVTCHHTTEGDAAPQSCFECHKAETTADAPAAKKVFHDLCTDCHRKQRREKPESKPPTSCKECHDASKIPAKAPAKPPEDAPAPPADVTPPPADGDSPTVP